MGGDIRGRHRLGPIIGGVLLEHYAWNSIFWVCSVIGAVALACIAVAVPEVRAYRSERFDFPGTVLSVAGVGLLVWAIIERPTYGWLSWQVIGGICAALIILAVFAAVEGHTHAPLIDVGLFRRATFTSSTCAICVAFFCLFGFIFITTQWFQALRGYTALQTAVATLPFAVVMAAVAPLATQLAKRSDTGRSSRQDCCSCRRACSWSRVSTPIAATGSWSYPPWP